MPSVQPPHLQSLASGLPSEVGSKLLAAFGAADKYNRDIAQALNSTLAIGDSLQVSTPYTQARPLVVPSETGPVYARASRGTTQAIPSAAATVIDYATKDSDAWGMVTTGASWKATIPTGQDGIYRITAATRMVSFNSSTTTQGTVLVNGSTVYYGYWGMAVTTAGGDVVVTGTIDLNLVATNYVQWRVQHDFGADRNVAADATASWITITKVVSAANTSPSAPSCFPFDVLWPKSYPPTVVLAQCADANANAPARFEPMLPDWVTVTQGGRTLIRVKNIPGLVGGKSYSVTLVAF